MQNAFAAGKSAAMIATLNGTIHAMRAAAPSGRAHVFYTQQGFEDGRTCDGHTNYQRHWAARGDPDDCLATVVGEPGWELIPSIAAPLSVEPVIRKEVYDAFFEGTLHAQLQQRGVDTVVLSGWETNV